MKEKSYLKNPNEINANMEKKGQISGILQDFENYHNSIINPENKKGTEKRIEHPTRIMFTRIANRINILLKLEILTNTADIKKAKDFIDIVKKKYPSTLEAPSNANILKAKYGNLRERDAKLMEETLTYFINILNEQKL